MSSSFCLLVYGAFFCILSANVASACIILILDFVRDMYPFVLFAVAFLFPFILYYYSWSTVRQMVINTGVDLLPLRT